MHISKECNGKSRVEYEMSNKQWVINEIFNEKAKKSPTFFELRSDFFGIRCLKKLSAPNVRIDPIVRTGTYFFLPKSPRMHMSV